ncbi:Signal transduction histidine kinase [Flavobacterium swingsii]|jgi:signal transduction histidine kinase|uniref:histidine kinase n=1 Tax=Flavobacterium swingsii TaxID=498292 RepID=A0A1I0V3W6_9FLAO|nr:ATP-binding protein [Flavobacterium swingsii]SFA71015.1 Signal transduction histidine kinase [Flavobacterium swingsii]
MTKFNNISTYKKIVWSNVIYSIAFSLLFFSLYYYTLQQEKQIYKSSKEQFENEVNSLLILNSESNISTITDITYWDELVNFIQTKDEKWFESSIAASLSVYKVDYLVAYDLQTNPVMKASTDKVKLDNFIPKEVFPKLYKDKLLKFYIKLPQGMVEVYGATIHPSNDPLKNKTKPSGYFFMVRVLDDVYFNKLEKISSSEISFLAVNDTVIDNNSIIKTTNLLDWKGNAIGKLSFKRNLKVDFGSTKNILYIIFVAFLIGMFLRFYFTKKWIHEPLKLITRVLETGNKKAVKLLKSSSTEFGHIGNMFEENIKQKQQLEFSKQKAEESDNLKSAFLTNLSHEIRTPMNAIVGFSDLLNNKNLSDQERLEYLGVITQSGSNLVSIIDDLVEMSKIDAKQITPNYTSINLESCLNELYNQIKITIPKGKTIDFELIKAENPIANRILTDEIKLKQIIINLITNAIKFTEEGFVTFGYEANIENSTISFTINDTGLGIDDAHQEIIFDRFRRIDGDYAIKVGGLGLGLAISKAYIEMLGGTISLQSKVGVGSRFLFTIPLVFDKKESNIPLPIIQQFVEETNGNETILVAEDDNINFLLLEKIMQLKNYKIIRAKNGQEAVSICRDNKNIDLVLMDIKMPILSGYEALAKIKVFSPELPIIAQTAYSSSEDQEKMKQAGFVNYITKPINKEKLFQIIAETLA